MNEARVRELWAKYLSKAPLSAAEEVELADALGSSTDLREELFREAQLDGLLGNSERCLADADGFKSTVDNCVAAELDGSRFRRRIDSELTRESNAKASDESGGSGEKIQDDSSPKGRKRTRRTIQTEFRSGANLSLWIGLAAATFLFGIALFFAGGSSTSDTSSDEKHVSQGRGEKERPSRVEGEQETEKARKERMAAIEREKEQAAQAEREALARKEEAAAKAARERKAALEAEREKIERKTVEPNRPPDPNPTPAPKSEPPPESPRKEDKIPATPQKPQQETQVTLLRVERTQGEVVLLEEEKRTPIRVGQELMSGQGLETVGADSSASLIYPDKTRIDVGPATKIEEFKVQGGKRVKVAIGSVRAEVAKQPKDEPMIVATAHGEAIVRGTTLRILIDPDPKKGMRLDVEEGKVELKNMAGKTVLVESGHYAAAATGAEFAPKNILDDPAILIAHWTLDEAGGTQVADLTARGLTGVLKNGTARLPGKFGRALYFDGVDDYAEIAHHPSLEPTGAMTVSAWILLTKLPPKDLYSHPVVKEQSYGFLVDPNGGVAFVVQTENNPMWSAGTSSGSRPLPLNTWAHVAGTWDGSRVRMYSHGVLGETSPQPLTGTIFKGGAPLYLGKSTANNILPFSGMLDDLRIYNRALTLAEIQTLVAQRNKPGPK